MNILVVEDEGYTLEEIVEYITEYDADIRCIACEDPVEALEKAEQSKVDIAFLDIEMPRMSGIELASRLLNIHPEIKIAFITAYNNYASEAFEVNAVDYLLKPLRKERFYNTLKKLAAEQHKTYETYSISIKTFGKLIVENKECELKWKRQKAAEIFAFLLFNRGKAVHKDTLCDILWPDYEPAKALVNLQTVMYQLRKSLAEVCKEEIYIEYLNHSYKLIIGNCYLDADVFEENYQKAFDRKSVREEYLLKAYQVYSDEYLSEEGWLWALPMQQNLELKYRRILEVLIDLSEKRQQYDRLIEYTEKIFELLSEDEFERYFKKISKLLGTDRAVKWRNTLIEYKLSLFENLP